MTDKHATPVEDRRPNHLGFKAGNGHATSEPDVEGALDVAPLEKLRAEVRTLQENAPPSRFDRYIPLITLVCTLITIIVGISEFRSTARETRKQSETARGQFLAAQSADHTKFLETLRTDSARDQNSRLHDYAKTYGQSRSAIYLEAVNAAALVASRAASDPERAQAEKLFWRLYWGRMILVEDQDVELKMVDFGGCLDNSDSVCRQPQKKQKRLQVFSFRLARACRVSEANTYDANDAYLQKTAHDLLEDDQDQFLPK